MRIREVKPEDREKWIEIVDKADGKNEKWAVQKFESYVFSKKKKKLLIVEDKGNVIGFSGVKGEDIEENVEPRLNNEYMVVNWIAVLPEYRNKGIGSKILSKCWSYVKKWKKKGMWLGCRDSVVSFYEKNGFRKEGTYVNDKGRKENVMVRERQ